MIGIYHLRNDLNAIERRKTGSPLLLTPPTATTPVRISNLESIRNGGYAGLFSADIPGVSVAPMIDAGNKTLLIMTGILIAIGILNLMSKRAK